MNILFVDDLPEYKVDYIVEGLLHKNLHFSYEICKSACTAFRYIVKHLNEIDLAIIDLGLPNFDNELPDSDVYGLEVVEFLLRKNMNIPIIIHSTTEIPAKKLRTYISKSPQVMHVKALTANFVADIIKKNQ